MASLLLKTEGLGSRVLELKLGVNRFGRGADNDFQIPHPTVSTQHCEVLLSGGQIIVRDCDSTNGTYLDDEPLGEEVMRPGQILRLLWRQPSLMFRTRKCLSANRTGGW